MTTMLLSATGSVIGGAVGGPFGAIVGRMAGAVAGSTIDQRLFGGNRSPRRIEGPRLTDLEVQASSEGAAILQVFGRARISGQIIWATRFEEVVATEPQPARGGKGGTPRNGGGAATTYSYLANLAIGLCEGPIAHIARVWADGQPIDTAPLGMRVYVGSETQEPDPLIQARQGTADVPGYRGLAYVVFERLPLAPYGNRLPQFTFEVIRPIGSLEKRVTAVNLIPGATEFGYHTALVHRSRPLAGTASENRIAILGGTDYLASISELQRICPNLSRVALVVGWFGTDLRCGQCEVKPGVEIPAKDTVGDTWRVSSIERPEAHRISIVDGRVSYGGTPSDASVLAAIADLKARGLKVTFTPFLFMDLPPDNGRTDPWTGAASQPVHPWRGRITCDPGPGRPGSPDGTGAATAQVDTFFGTAQPGHFSPADGTIAYSGPAEWSYRRMILHYAHLCVLAGGVDTFLLGTELRSLTRIRSDRRAFPAVAHLVQLAAEVKAIVGSSTLVSYAADWTEYGSYVPPDRPNDVLFPLDPVWAHPAVERVGIDYYAPLTDWRDGEGHADAALSVTGLDRAYLHSRLGAGEAFDWYYADAAARAAQVRLPITDGAYGKPWTYRTKDLAGWWGNAHVERLDGVEVGATSWVPHSKPIRLAELGVPAVDKGGNQPNLFPDPRSSEGAFPFASNRSRDDFVQRRIVEVMLEHFDPTTPWGASANPVSPLDGRRMVEHDASHLWCWDARPWPAFPARSDVWGDAENWRTGHWLTGRLGAAPLDALLEQLVARYGGPAVDTGAVEGVVQGYVIDRPMSGRAAIEPIIAAFGIDLVERAGVLVARPRGGRPVATIDAEALAVDGRNDRARYERTDESELPRVVTVTVSDAERDYRRIAVSSRRVAGHSRRHSRSDLALLMPAEEAEAMVDLVLRRAWVARDSARFALPISGLALEAGDVIDLVADGARRTLRVTKIETGALRRVEAVSEDPSLARPPPVAVRPVAAAAPPPVAGPFVVTLDLPRLPGNDAPHRPLVAATAEPWPGGLTVWRALGGSLDPVVTIERPAMLGTLLDELPAGPVWRFDRSASARVDLARGTLASVSEEAVLDGANVAAVRHPNGRWEVVQFATATLIAPSTYRLSIFLRGQAGTEDLAASPVPSGSLFVRLDALTALPTALDDIGRPTAWRAAPLGLGFDDPAATSFAVTPGGIGLIPLAPVHARARRVAGGVEISFVRRTRVDGDGWNLADIPLGEDVEAYATDIMDGATVKRSLVTTTPFVLYTSADEIADFGAPRSSHSVRIRQMSSVLGPGKPLLATLAV
jgi:hypothetical protein